MKSVLTPYTPRVKYFTYDALPATLDAWEVLLRFNSSTNPANGVATYDLASYFTAGYMKPQGAQRLWRLEEEGAPPAAIEAGTSYGAGYLNTVGTLIITSTPQTAYWNPPTSYVFNAPSAGINRMRLVIYRPLVAHLFVKKVIVEGDKSEIKLVNIGDTDLSLSISCDIGSIWFSATSAVIRPHAVYRLFGEATIVGVFDPIFTLTNSTNGRGSTTQTVHLVL